MSTKRFRIAFSFAGEKRDFVAKVAAVLASKFGQEKILYDKYHEAEFARYDLGIYLPKLYRQQADLVVAVICPNYDEKLWTGWEWMAIYSQLSKKEGHNIMLCRFEHAHVDGLFDAAAFVELDQKTPEQAATLILERLALNEGLPREHYTFLPTVPKDPTRNLVYISYSHRDKPWHQKLRKILDADPELRDLVWDDTKIGPSVPWDKDIADHLQQARAMIMLVSEDYLNPDSGANRYEMQPALAAHKSGEMAILWIPIKDHDYRLSPVGHIMAATGPGAVPLESLLESDQRKNLQRVHQAVRQCLGLPEKTKKAKRTITPNPSPAQANPKPFRALQLWKEKLEALQIAEATLVGVAQKFELAQQIAEAKQKIAELGG